MCKWLNGLFKKQLVLPYPEEKPDYSQTIDNVNVQSVIGKWLVSYFVPEEYWSYWRTKIDIKIVTDISYPAGVWEENEIRHMNARPEWLNPGVIAHEQAHNSLALLPDVEKADLGHNLSVVKEFDPLVKLLFKTNTYGLTSDVECHAEIYRYLGDKMPEVLKRYYPRLF